MIIRKLRCLALIALGIVGVSSFFGQEAPASGGRGEGGANFGRGGNGGRGRGPLGGAAAGFIQTPVYDKVQPELPADLKPGGILIYSKTNGFREEAGIQASDVALAVISKERGWPYYVTENAAIMNKDQLARFKVVVWNNNSGDTLTQEQREAFKNWLENGGSYVGIHGAGGDPKYQPPITRSSLADWPWYIDSVVGAQFTSHSPQQPGDAHVEDLKSPITKGLPAVFRRTDEWYAFATNPREKPGFHILITADEKSYTPGRSTMGADHPLAWWHCVGKGHAFYSALGHGGMMYAEPVLIQLYGNALTWALKESGHACSE
ncbi:MAG TPA: ThuA domain-containing protein [Bryobacteraceae bacterium]|nr:ThuA domain-containing protein [Bryobacteraceae bacterium]